MAVLRYLLLTVCVIVISSPRGVVFPLSETDLGVKVLYLINPLKIEQKIKNENMIAARQMLIRDTEEWLYQCIYVYTSICKLVTC